MVHPPLMQLPLQQSLGRVQPWPRNLQQRPPRHPPSPPARQQSWSVVQDSLGCTHPTRPTQVPRLEQLPLQHCLSLLQSLPLGVQPGGSAAAIPPKPSDPSVPPRRAAPISLSALRRERLPLASSLASSSKERSLASGDIGSILSLKGRGQGKPRPVDQCSLVCEVARSGATSENPVRAKFAEFAFPDVGCIA
jgi:hypothetical protein